MLEMRRLVSLSFSLSESSYWQVMKSYSVALWCTLFSASSLLLLTGHATLCNLFTNAGIHRTVKETCMCCTVPSNGHLQLLAILDLMFTWFQTLFMARSFPIALLSWLTFILSLPDLRT